MHNKGEESILGQKLGPYYVSERLGHGGMGAVYLARDLALDRPVALKVLLPRYADDPEFVARFQREARASAKLSHPNIVQIYAVDIESDPAYMAMEYVDGETLEARILRAGPLTWQQALNVVSQVASALACAHAAGIIHRDIKPANVLIDKKNRVRVADFGIAKVMGSQTKLTSAQNTVGSPCYMSPEQCGVGEVSPASDLFSLGIMLYEMLTGTLPFKGESSLAVMRQITTEDLPRVTLLAPSVPPVVQQLLDTLAAREVALRYKSAQEVLDDLKGLHASGSMNHAGSLSLKRAATAPPTASAAHLTRSPTGPSPALKTSLVSELLDDVPAPPVKQRRGFDLDIPWLGIALTAGALVLGILVMLFLNRPHDPRRERPGVTEPERPMGPPPPGNPQGPQDSFRTQPRPDGPVPAGGPQFTPQRPGPGGVDPMREGGRVRDPNRPRQPREVPPRPLNP